MVEPKPELTEQGDRIRARVLTSMMAIAAPLGFTTVLFQLFTRPGFLPTFITNSLALAFFAAVGVVARTRHYRKAAAASAVVTVAACAAAGLNNPDDAVWWAYAILAVVFATVLISIRGAAIVALVAVAAVIGVGVINGTELETLVGPVMFHLLVSPLLLIFAHHRNQLEEDRRRALATQRELLEDAQRVARIGHWRWRPDRDAFEASSSLERLLGLSEGRHGSADFVACFGEERRAELTEALGRVEEQAFSLEVPLAEGEEERYALVSAALQPETVPAVVVGTVQDVTERVKGEREKNALQRQLHEAQRLETVGRIAGGIAHDFNNLLMAIRSSAEHVGLSEGEERAEALRDIEEASERAAGLVRQLLAYARKQVLAPTHLDLHRIARDLEPLLERVAKGVTIEVNQVGDRPPTVTADRSQLEQVLLNLVINAAAASGDEGRVEIRTGVVDSGPTDASLEDRMCAYLAVADNGSGMTEEVRARAFEPYFTTRSDDGGTGLGLATVYGIVHQSGGAIELESAPGVGTTFRMFFPLDAVVHETPTRGSERPSRTDTQTILVVDDEAMVLRSVARMLRRLGFEVLTAESSHDAEQLWRENRRSIDMVLSDVVMPDVGGVEFASKLREEEPELGVVLMSGFSESFVEGRVPDPSIPLLRKPFSREQLFEVMDQIGATESRQTG